MDGITAGFAAGRHAFDVERAFSWSRLSTNEDAADNSFRRLREVAIDGVLRGSIDLDATPVEQEAALCQAADRAHVVADKQDRAPAARDRRHLAQALLLELAVADAEHLVDAEILPLERRRHSKFKPHVQPAGDSFY